MEQSMMICLCIDAEKKKGRAMSGWNVTNVSTTIVHLLLELGLLQTYVNQLKWRETNDKPNLLRHVNV